MKSVQTTSYSNSWSSVYHFVRDTAEPYNTTETDIILFDSIRQAVKRIHIYNQDTLGFCEWEYNTKGKVSKQTDFREQGRFERLKSYEYVGDTLTIERYYYQPDVLHVTWEYHTDSVRKKKWTVQLFKDEIKDYFLEQFEDSFYTSKTYYARGNGPLVQTGARQLDHQYRPVVYRWWNSGSKTYTHEVHVYDALDRIIQTQFFDSCQRLIKTKELSYDSQSNEITTTTIYPDGERYTTYFEYRYDSYGNWIWKRSFYKQPDGRNYETKKFTRVIAYY
ncbi:MAG: hypothetical protein KDC76_01100 [Bacteroidetes bacterium]|nr:hypothetical protein [Bacteroidota bacterium]